MFVDWTCSVASCGLEQTTPVVPKPGRHWRAGPCARCRTLHLLESATPVPAVVLGPNGAPLVLGPNLYAKCTTAIPAERPAPTSDTET